MKQFLLTLSLTVMALAASAVPAKRGLTRTLTLADGTTVTAQLIGDEHGHYWLAPDGRAYQQLPNANFFAEVNPEVVTERANARRQRANARRSARLQQSQRVGEYGNYTGSKKGLIILVNYTDVTFRPANTPDLFDRIANEENFKKDRFVGSIHDYFYAQSEGVFDLTFDVVGPYTVSNTQAYYGGNDRQGNDLRPAEMVIEACQLADPDVNYPDYDWDGDGFVDQVYVIYAGNGEADSNVSNSIWPHEWTLSSAQYYGDGSGAQTLDGVKIDTYACGGELNGNNAICGIGTMCHEFSHCLGYPDFYDTDYSGGQGMFEWDLMDSGSYNGDGYQPAGYTSYERWVAGWKEPIALTTTTQVSNLKSLQEGGSAYIVYNQGDTNEYFLLENRQQTGWDAGIPGEGLLILHVDYDADVWASNEPNDDPSHQRMTWIAADNKYQYTTYEGSKYYTTEGAANDPFPYGSVNAFSKSTTPAAKFFNKNTDGTYYLDSSIEQITHNADGTVSFRFKAASNVAKPTFSPAAGRYTEAQTVTISCATEGTTIYYTTDGSTPTASSTRYTQPIVVEETTTLKAIAINADNEESPVATAKYSIGNALLYESASRYDKTNTGTAGLLTTSQYLDYDNWAVLTNVYIGGTSDAYDNGGSLKLSSGKANGSMKTGTISLTGTGTLTFYLKRYNETESASLSVSVSGATADVTQFSAANDWKKCVVELTDANGSVVITLSATKRVYIDEIELVAGATQPVTKQDVTMAFSEASATATVGQAFTAPTLSMNPSGLAVTYSSSNTAVATVDASTGAVTLVAEGTTTITATFDGNNNYNPATASYELTVSAATTPTVGTDRYELVTDASTLAAGDKLLIVYAAETKIMSTSTVSDNYRVPGNFDFNDDKTITPTENDAIVVLGGSNGAWTLYVSNGDEKGYLSAASSSKNNMKTVQTVDKNAQASISISSSNATIKFQGSYEKNLLKYNTGNPRFSCYASNSTGTYFPRIYRQIKQTIEMVDINRDGEQTIADVTALVNILLGKATEANDFDKYDFQAADVDGDGSRTVADLTELVKRLLGKQ